MYEAGSDGVVWWSDYADESRRHASAGLLDRCRATETCPKIVETFGSSEFYNLRASPDLVGTRADRDIPLPSNVRRYYFPGVSHGGGPGGFDPDPKHLACCELAPNPNPSSDTLRALQTALVDWVVKGALPPPRRLISRIPGQRPEGPLATRSFLVSYVKQLCAQHAHQFNRRSTTSWDTGSLEKWRSTANRCCRRRYFLIWKKEGSAPLAVTSSRVLRPSRRVDFPKCRFGRTFIQPPTRSSALRSLL
jgi:Alpha/beta hydrolase domain